MRKSAAERAPGTISGRERNSGPMAQFALPITEVLVVADCWQAEPDAEAVIQRAFGGRFSHQGLLVAGRCGNPS